MVKRKRKKKPVRKKEPSKVVSSGPSSPKAAKQSPRFTVAMATYNRAKWLPAAIESVLKQSFTDFEYVIVDDGSTDNTAEVIGSYTDPRIRYIRKPKNEGRPATRNRVVAESSGTYILWMADDDLLGPDILATYHRKLCDDPSIDVLYGNLAVFTEDHTSGESAYEPIDWSTRPLDFLGAKLGGSVLPDPGTATRLSIVKEENGPYDLEFLRAQDYELWSRIAHRIKVKKVDESVYFYRQHSDSASFGDFVDTTFESKIIRKHVARHPGGLLAPQFDWRYQVHAQARLHLLISEYLNQYRDGYNALRFAYAVPQWDYEPLVVKQVVIAHTIQGQLEEAKRVTRRAMAQLPQLSDTFENWLQTIEKLAGFSQETAASLSDGFDEKRLNELRSLVSDWGWTYDLARVFGHLNENAGDLKKAALAFCYAARLNLKECECHHALERIAPKLNMSRGKIDLVNMRQRILESHVDLPSHLEGPSMSDRRIISILDLHHDNPQIILDRLAGQAEDTYEVVGFYSLTDPPNHVVSCARPENYLAQIQALSEAANGAWVVLADEAFSVYENWTTSILITGAGTGESKVQFCAQHEPDPQSENAFLSLKSMVPLREVLAGTPVQAHRFVIPASVFRVELDQLGSRTFTTMSELRLYYAAHWISHKDAIHHVGATQVFSVPSAVYDPGVLMHFFHRHQRSVLFDKEVRRQQNELLHAEELSFGESGRVTIALLAGPSSSETIASLNALMAKTFVPNKPLVLCNTPSEEMMANLRNARSSIGHFDAIINHRAVNDTKLVNQSFTRMGTEYIVLLDPSIRLPKTWLGHMIWQAAQIERLGLVCLQIDHESLLDFRCCLVTRLALETVGGLALDLAMDDAFADFVARVKRANLIVMETDRISISTVETLHPAPLSNARAVSPRRPDGVSALFFDYAPEPGFLPNAQPITIHAEHPHRLLVYPPWDDEVAMVALVQTLGNLAGWTVYLRCEPLQGEAHLKRLSALCVTKLGHEFSALDVQLVDALLAPEREAGLFTSVDLIYADKNWSQSGKVTKRAYDCGCRIAVTDDELQLVISRFR